MRNAIIVPNTLKQKSVEYAKRAELLLLKSGYNVQVYNDGDTPLENAEFAVVLGGDGTILRTAKRFYGMNIPLFGINFGHLGYLSAIGPDEADDGIKKLIRGDFTVEERIMLEGRIIRENQHMLKFVGLNEICVSRSTLVHAFSSELLINNKHTDTIIGDGVIISTPTGSTAYNLSAGGPVLTPTSKNMVITPVSPTYFPHLSIVIDDDDEAQIVIKYETMYENGKPCIEIDGESRYVLENNDIIKVTRAPYTAKIIKISDKSFYQILREKMSRASR